MMMARKNSNFITTATYPLKVLNERSKQSTNHAELRIRLTSLPNESINQPEAMQVVDTTHEAGFSVIKKVTLNKFSS